MFWCKTIKGNYFTPHRVFGCAWKIEFSEKQNFPENNFSWPCVLWLWPGKYFALLFSLQMISGLRHAKREREHKERLERVRSGSRRRAQTTAISLDMPLSSRRLAARSRHKACTTRSRWGYRPAEIAPWDRTLLDRTIRSSHRPLDRILFVSISAPPKACRRWITCHCWTTELFSSRSTSPFPSICDHSLFLLPLSVWLNGFVYWEWFCFDFFSLKVYILQFSIIKFVW